LQQSFNSATTFQPRKHRQKVIKQLDDLVASIRPRPFSRGNGSLTIPIFSANSSLQFGHDLSAVETNMSMAEITREDELQFGHDLSAVETSI